MSPRRIRRYAGALAVLAGFAFAGAPVAMSTRAEPDERAAVECTPPDYPGSGYFTSLTVRNVSCATGRKLARAYYRCRTRNGPRGRCHHRVLRFKCTEERNSIPTEIDARVRCRRDGQRVTHTYQQNL